MVLKHEKQEVTVVVGRHSRFEARARFVVDGQEVNLEGDGYTAQAWVTPPGGPTQGPRACTVSGAQAVYELQDGDLATASGDAAAADSHTTIVIVADRANPPTRLVSDRRVVKVGEWPGSTSLDPA